MSGLVLDQVRILAGPNVWARVPVIEASFDGDAAAALCAARRVLRLQNSLGCKVSFAAAAEGRIGVEFEHETLALRCLEAAAASHALESGAALPQLRELAGRVVLGANTRALANAARRRSIPVRRLDDGSLLQLGHGIYQRRLCGAFTDRTSSIAETVSWDKRLAKDLLAAVGVPVPEGRLVTDATAAWQAAQDLGGLVVVKPESANHGRAVFIGLSGQDRITAAFETASKEGSTPNVVVERFVLGAEHRVLVIGGRVAAASRSDPLYVTGDGQRSIAQLVDEVNADPRRGPESECPLDSIAFDEVVLSTLAGQGYAPGAVPAAGDAVLVRRNGNHSANVTDCIHPGNRDLCLLAAQTIGLDVAGIDLVVADLSHPIREQDGAFLEVNAMPGLLMHLHPGAGAPVPVDDMIIEMLFPEGAPAHIPIIAVNSPLDGCALRIATALERQGLCTGVVAAAGVFAEGRKSGELRRSAARATLDLLLHPRLEAAVVEMPDEAVLSGGLGFDQCRVAVFDRNPRLSPTPAQTVLLDSLAADGALVCTARPEAVPAAVLDALCVTPR